MPDAATEIYTLLYEQRRLGQRRYTQDTPMLPDAWLSFARAAPWEPVKLLVTPHANYRAPQVLKLLHDHRLLGDDTQAAANESHVRLQATFPQALALLRASPWIDLLGDRITRVDVLTRTLGWFHKYATLDALRDPAKLKKTVLDPLFEASPRLSVPEQTAIEFWAVVATVAAHSAANDRTAVSDVVYPGLAAFEERVINALGDVDVPRFIWSISVNRDAELALVESRKTVKADAAQQLFRIAGRGVRWAVIDSGIDAMHPAFVDRDQPVADGDASVPFRYPIDPARSRVVETLDFTRLNGILQDSLSEDERRDIRVTTGLADGELSQLISEIREALYGGRMLDWPRLARLLRVVHNKTNYVAPEVQHGTHVAGIIGADWRATDYGGKDVPPDLQPGDIVGMCPEIELVDLRVFKEQTTDEFTLLAALQYIRWLNQSKDLRSVHGANLSFSLPHDVRNFACGRTPICEECERLWGTGVVLVAAAGNFGFAQPREAFAMGDAYRNISVTDPGNAECVITVGSTHRSSPHAYGVSYFSSRGPTGDGRLKPDILAPGEKIRSTVPGGGLAVQDGTSMAAPHVSGIAALIMSRNVELQGQPERIKNILCKSATDLGRERYFQGAGLVDVLRALQSI